MPYLQQMYPKKTLDAADLAAAHPHGVVVTIEGVDFKTYDSRDVGETEVAWYLKVREFKKPFKLNQSNAYAVGDLLGSHNTDDWFGKTIGLRAVQIKITDQSTKRPKMIWTFDIDLQRPVTQPTLQPNQDITGASAFGAGRPPAPGLTPGTYTPPADGVTAKIGVDKAAEVVGAFEERGKTPADFIKHMDSLGLGELVSGKEPPDWPTLALATARKFVQMFPKSKAPATPERLEQLKAMWRPPPPPAPTEVIDKKSGEVITPAGSSTGSPEIPEDDIPF